MQYTILPVALRLADGTYLPSTSQAIGRWDEITVIPCKSANDPHSAVWALFQTTPTGEPFRFRLVCDDPLVAASTLDTLQCASEGGCSHKQG